jgi:MFS family permease
VAIADQTGTKRASMTVIAMLAAAQFIMVLDTTVMNVSISQVVEDLDTTVVGVQSAITIYTLVMASLMLLGGKLSDRWGPKRAFAIGLLIYGAGSLMTALARNLTELLVGWSFIEGMGAALVIPAIASLIVHTYEGSQRALAYGILGGVSGASAALGPLIGGWVATVASWRVVFAGETVLVLVLVSMLALIPATEARRSQLDMGGVALSVSGLGLGVFAVLRSSQWGWILPGPQPPEIAGVEITPLGLSPTIWLLVISAILLGWLVRHEARVTAAGREPLIDVALLKIFQLRAGLIMLAAQQFMIMATFFVLPLYLQSVLGFDALKTGITILPLSLALFVCALGGAALSRKFTPRQIVRVGVIAMLVGELITLAFVRPDLGGAGFGIGLALVGAGLGLLASQLGNVIMSAAPAGRGGEAGGLQGTAQNLGASLGTALIGSVLIGVLASRFSVVIESQEDLSPELRIAASQAITESANFVSTEDVKSATEAAGLSAPEVEAVTAAYAEAQLTALRAALAGIALFAFATLAYLRYIPVRYAAYAAKDDARAAPSAPSAPADGGTAG